MKNVQRTWLSILLVAAAAACPCAQAQEGHFDPGWSSVGRRLVDFSSESDIPTHMLIAPDGKVLVAGWCGPAFTAGNRTICAARLHPDGALDTGFGPSGNGTLQFNEFSGAAIPYTAGIARSNDGSLWFAAGGEASDIRIWRLSEDGTAMLGSITFHFSAAPALPVSIAQVIRPVGSSGVIVAGSMRRDDTSLRVVALVRLVLDGNGALAIDPTFGVDGVAVIPQGKAVSDVVMLADGRMLLSVLKNPGVNIGTTAVIVRLLADGAIDTTFGATDGVASLPSCAGSFRGDGTLIAVDGIGRIAVAFTAEYRDAQFNSLPSEICVNRLHPDGQQDGSFGGTQVPGGTGHPVRVNIGGSQSLESIAVGADNKIIVGGTNISDSGVPCSIVCFMVARLGVFPRVSAVLDPSFGDLGSGVFRYAADSSWNGGNALAIGNGGLMIAGYAAHYSEPQIPERFGIARLKLGAAAFAEIFSDGFE